MSDVAIEVAGIGKRYRLGGPRLPYRTLRDSISRSVSTTLRRAARLLKGRIPTSDNEFWALRDVSFEIKKGEAIGLVGRNGAGKSTLLKILSRITEPTVGSASLWGRVGSLLEVGTGFHGELTGRENIFLNGSILGMKRAETAAQFDAIVAFAEVERFIDTPVKHYSSGMYLRLAFAVAAHLNPEILLVDEVLAVGDAEFQRKCLGKMGDVTAAGRTVVLVSHNMAAVRALCNRALLLQDGRVVLDGPVESVIRRHLASRGSESGERTWPRLADAPGDDVVRLQAVRLRDDTGQLTSELLIHEALSVEIEYWVLKPGHPLDAYCYFVDEMGATRFVSLDNLESPWRDTVRPPGLYRSTCHVPSDLFSEGTVRVHALLNSSGSHLHAVEHDAVVFRVVDDMDTRGVRGNYRQEWPQAAVRPRLVWDVRLVSPLTELEAGPVE